MKSRNYRSIVRSVLLLGVVAGAACDNGNTAPRIGIVSIKLNPCTPSGTITLAVATAALTDCSAGGTTLTLAGGGANYLIVPQFPTETAADQFVNYQLFTGPIASATSMSVRRLSAARRQVAPTGGIPRSTEFFGRNMTAQFAAERVLRARAARNAGSAMISASRSRQLGATLSRAITVPPAGSMRNFFVASSFNVNSYATVTAKLEYVGTNVLIYVDTTGRASGFTAGQLSAVSALFDSTLYPIDTAAFGGPSDEDANGHVIMLMSPVVNADTPTSECQTQGYVGGFFDTNDFTTNPTSNNGEIFYAVVPDPTAKFSCAHTVGGVDSLVPSTFVHELQHLINYSQHVVVSGGQPSSSWLDEGLSILAEELGSLYYENKYPCPTHPQQCTGGNGQLFPDSSQGFVQDFLYDSYQYAYLPDTASIMLSNDSENGFSWRGGAWLFARYLGDHFGSTVFKQLETGPSDAMPDVQNATGQPFTTVFENFGLALYTDSLPGLPRTTAPLANRFTSRNVSQLWARLYTTSAGPDIPTPTPLYLGTINTDSSSSIAYPGTMTFWQLSTLAADTTVTIQYSPPGGVAFPSVLHSQIAVFRLP